MDLRILVSILLVLALNACKDDTELHRVCGQPCAFDNNGNVLFGQDANDYTCHLGKYYCPEDNSKEAVCVGSYPPIQEVCSDDGIDYDCDGIPNNLIYQVGDFRNTCEQPADKTCNMHTQQCIHGNMTCVVTNPCGPEICDGIDNDGDGLIDADDPDLILSGPEWEYDGPPETTNVGLCRAGHRECHDGHEVLEGQILPSPEICGSHQDENCDGQVDEVGAVTPQAFALVLDISGSMSGTISIVANTLCDWSTSGRFTTSKFAIITVGTTGDAPFIDQVTDFVGPQDACNNLVAYLLASDLAGGTELVPYGIWGLHNDPNFNLTWPLDMTARVVFFTDEQPQGYLLTAETDMDNVAEDCVTNNYSVGGFVNGNHFQWYPMTTACNGWVENLETNETDMRNILDQRFGSECPTN